MRAIVTILILVLIGAGGYFGYQKFIAGEDRVAQIETASFSEEVRFFEAMGDTAPSAPAADNSAFIALTDAASGFLAINYGSVDGDVAKDVTITPADNDKVGVRIDELRLWGADAVELQKLKGRGDESGVLVAERLDARGMTWFGFDTLTEEMMDAYTDTIVGVVEGASGEDNTDTFGGELTKAMDMDFERYDFKTKRAVVDGLMFYPLGGELAAVDAEDRAAEMMRLFQQMGQKSVIRFSAPLSGYKGVKRGDLDLTFIKDIDFDMQFEIPASEFAEEGDDAAVDSNAPPFEMAMSGGADLYTFEGIKLAKVFEYLADGEMPPLDDTDLMSMGIMRILGENYAFDGEPFYSVKETVIDLSEFHWFVPSKIRLKSDDIVYNIEGLLNWVGGITAQSGEADSAEVTEMMTKVASILKDNDLSVMTFDMDMGGVWDPDNGASMSDFFLDFEDFGRIEVKSAGALPNYNAVTALAPKEGEAFDGDALTALAMEQTALKDFSFALTDDGGVDKSFKLAVAFAELAPDGDPGMAMFKGANGADLKLSSAAMLRISAGQMGQAFPPAKDYMLALADFIQKGGVLKIEANPEKPVTLGEIESASANGDPAAVVDLLGFTVTRESK